MYNLDETRLYLPLALFLTAVLTLTACGSEEVSLDAGISDPSLVDAVVECTTNVECNDGLYCNGDESCSDTGQCEAGILVVCNDGIPCTLDSCSNGTRQCEFVAPDIDEDGHRDSSCEDDNGLPLGDDCDDLVS